MAVHSHCVHSHVVPVPDARLQQTSTLQHTCMPHCSVQNCMLSASEGLKTQEALTT